MCVPAVVSLRGAAGFQELFLIIMFLFKANCSIREENESRGKGGKWESGWGKWLIGQEGMKMSDWET